MSEGPLRSDDTRCHPPFLAHGHNYMLIISQLSLIMLSFEILTINFVLVARRSCCRHNNTNQGSTNFVSFCFSCNSIFKSFVPTRFLVLRYQFSTLASLRLVQLP